MSLYNTDGQRQVTIVTGSTYTGIQAIDGSYNGVLNDGTGILGLYHPCGAYNVTLATNPNSLVQATNGSLCIIPSINGYALAGGPASSFISIPLFSAAIARVQNSTGNAKIAFVGDSNTAGSYSGPALAHLRSFSYPTKSSVYLSSLFGVTGVEETVMGDGGIKSTGGTSATYTGYDPRVTFAGGFDLGVTGTYSTVGGTPFVSNTIGAVLTFTPVSTAIDSFDVYYFTDTSGTSKGGLDINGGTSTPLSTNSVVGIGKTTITGTVGANTLHITATATDLRIAGIVAYNSTIKSLQVINMGWSGASSADWHNPGFTYNPELALAAIAPDLTVINLGINDLQLGLSLSTLSTNLQALITTAKLSGDVILVVPFPSDTAFNGNTTAIRQSTMRSNIQSVAATNSCRLTDLVSFFTDYTTANSKGYAANGLHPNMTGYLKMAELVSNTVTQGVTTSFDSVTTSLTTAMSSQPSTIRKAQINSLILALKAGKILSQLDLLYILAASDSQAASLNWVNPATFTLTASNSPTFTTDRGFTGNGTTSFLNTGYTPSINGVNYTLNNASFWEWPLTNIQSTGAEVGNVAVAPTSFITSRSTTDQTVFRVNTASNSGAANTNSNAFIGAQRTISTAHRAFLNGVQLGADGVVASTGLPTSAQWILACNSTSFSPKQIAAAAWGSGLSGYEFAFYNSMLTYMKAVGAQ